LPSMFCFWVCVYNISNFYKKINYFFYKYKINYYFF